MKTLTLKQSMLTKPRDAPSWLQSKAEGKSKN